MSPCVHDLEGNELLTVTLVFDVQNDTRSNPAPTRRQSGAVALVVGFSSKRGLC